MNESRWERYGASSGFAMVVLGAAATLFERTPVTAADFAANRTALLTQSMLFLAGAGISLWFVGCLRTYLSRTEGGSGRLSSIAFGAGVAWATLNMLAQAFQVGVASDPSGQAPAALLDTMTAVFTVANAVPDSTPALVRASARGCRRTPGACGDHSDSRPQ